MTQAHQPQPNLAEQISRTAADHNMYAEDATFYEGEAQRAENERIEAELRRSDIAAQAAAVSVNAAVTLVGQVDSVTDPKNPLRRAHTFATHYDINSVAGDDIQNRVAGATAHELAPAWRRIFLADTDTKGAQQHDEHSRRVWPSQSHEIHDSGRVVGPVARTVRRLIRGIGTDARRYEAEEAAQSSPRSGHLIPKLNPELATPIEKPKNETPEEAREREEEEKNRPITNISDAVAVAADQLRHHVDYVSDLDMPENHYHARLAASTPGEIRARLQVPSEYLSNLVDPELETEEYLAEQDELLALEGSLAAKAGYGQLANSEELPVVNDQLADVSDRLSDPSINPADKKMLENLRNMLLTLTGDRKATPEELVEYRDYFVKVASQQLGTIALRHAVRATTKYSSAMEEAHSPGGLREERRTILEKIRESQLVGFALPKGFADSVPKKDGQKIPYPALVAHYREGLRKQLDGIHERLENIGKMTVSLTEAQGAVLPSERTYIPQILHAATFDERFARRAQFDEIRRAEQAEENRRRMQAAADEAAVNQRNAAARLSALHQQQNP
jgi:hypothetical protein